MEIEVAAVGGYGESGRNMTAIRVGDEVVLFDMGLHLPNYIKLNDEAVDQWTKFTEAELKKAGAVPDDRKIKDWRDKVVAIVVTHGHLDHIGATPYLAPKYGVPVICPPFSASIIRTILKDDKLKMPNKLVGMRAGRKRKLSDNLTLEFVHTTHSTPQTVFAVLHTPKGVIVYGNDYKLDDTPTLGKPVDRDYLKKIGDRGVLALIQDCLYADDPRHMPSERVAKEKLWHVLSGINDEANGLIVTTFSSHVARLKAIAEFGNKLGRKVVFIGRSTHKYSAAARDASVTDLFKKAKILKYSRQAKRQLKSIQSQKSKFLLVASGHQGEPQSALSKMIDGRFPWKFEKGDFVVFSSKVIPAKINIEQRRVMDAKLHELGVKIFDEVHVSGHSAREDLRDIVRLLRPKYLLPTHGEQSHINAFNTLAKEEGYELGEGLFPLKNEDRLKLKYSKVHK